VSQPGSELTTLEAVGD